MCLLHVRILAHEDYKIGVLATVTLVSHPHEEIGLTSAVLL